jgi:hypothetical protein
LSGSDGRKNECEWRREEEERERAEALEASRAELAAIVERWAEAKRVEAFFEDAGRRAATLKDPDAADLLERWSARGNSSAAWMRSSASGRGRRRRSVN